MKHRFRNHDGYVVGSVQQLQHGTLIITDTHGGVILSKAHVCELLDFIDDPREPPTTEILEGS